MKKIAIFRGAKVMYDEELEKKGFIFSTNTGPVLEVIEATDKNIKKHFPEAEKTEKEEKR